MGATDGSVSFGVLLLRYRLAAGLSQEELAERAGLSRRGVSDLERGARCAPYPATVRRLVEALGLDSAERAGLLSSVRAASDTQRAPEDRPDAGASIHPVGGELPDTESLRLAELVRRHRLQAQLTQDALARKAGLSVRAISDLERGLRRFPYPDTLQRLEDALGLGDDDRALLESAAARLALPGQAQRHQAAATGVHAPARHNLPVQLTSFVGRVQQAADVRNELARTRLLTLTGPGGVGKTRLALRVAEAELDTFADGVWFVELAPLTEASQVPQSITSLFEVREKPDESLVASLAAALQRLHVLLILDNCEHLLAACRDLVQRLLRACPQLILLVTSREVLGLGAETVWRVPPLGASFADSEAAELFVERARTVQPGFALSPQTAPVVLELCRRLDGIPLAIELAASRVGAFGLEQLVERLATDARFLPSKDRTAVRRQQTLDNTIQWSYDLLTPDEQALFARLSVFTGGWTLKAMEAVAAGPGGAGHEPLDVLERLIDKSLVQVDDAPGRPPRYRLLEPLCQFARDRLGDLGEVTATHERHTAFFLEFFEEAEQEFLKQYATPRLVSRMDSELGNLRVALRWLISQAEAGRAQRLAGDARTLWLHRAYLTEGRRWLDEVLALDPPASPPIEPAARARALLGLTGVARYQGDLAVAEDAGLSAWHLFEALGDTMRASEALRLLGLAAGARADLAGARRFMEQALVANRDTGQVAALALTLCDLADLDLEKGDLVAAQTHAEETLKLATAAGHVALGCLALVNLAEVQRRLGRRDAAQRLWQKALTRVREAHRQHSSIVPALIRLGRQAGESDHARSCLIEGLLLAREGSRRELAHGLELVIEVAAGEGQVELVLLVAGAAAALRDRMATPPWPSERARLDAATSVARQHLTEDAADLAWMQGWTRPVDEAVGIALDFLQESSAAAAGDRPPMFFSTACSGPQLGSDGRS
jgi:predicted ATPase/transcriptional regulator with XRE-family HTH domain